jgi:hypothetical protein
MMIDDVLLSYLEVLDISRVVVLVTLPLIDLTHYTYSVRYSEIHVLYCSRDRQVTVRTTFNYDMDVIGGWRHQ